MIFKAPADTPNGLAKVARKGDKFKFTHIQNVEPAMELAKELRKERNNGWTKGRTMRHIASIPEIEFFNHPEWAQDPSAMLKWLRTEYGSQFKTVDKI